MVTIEKLAAILNPRNFEFENTIFLNPAVYKDRNTLHILFRAVQDGNLSCIGYAKTDGPMNIVERMEKYS